MAPRGLDFSIAKGAAIIAMEIFPMKFGCRLSKKRVNFNSEVAPGGFYFSVTKGTALTAM